MSQIKIICPIEVTKYDLKIRSGLFFENFKSDAL